MPYTVFVSYDTSPEEQVFVYRLQTLASVSGISVLLPQRNGQIITNETKIRIDSADVVIAFLTSKLTANVREELSYAQGKEKLIIPIYEKGVRIQPLKNFHWFEYDPRSDTPGTIEQEVLKFLQTKKKEKQNKNAVILVGLGLALLALIASKE